jgi:hypothetical protein
MTISAVLTPSHRLRRLLHHEDIPLYANSRPTCGINNYMLVNCNWMVRCARFYKTATLDGQGKCQWVKFKEEAALWAQAGAPGLRDVLPTTWDVN